MLRLHPMLAPFEPTSGDPWDRTKAAHLLGRAAWGGTRAEIERAFNAGPVGAINELLDFPNAASDEIAPDDGPDLSGISGYPKTFLDRKKLYEGKSAEERKVLNQQLNQANQEAIRAILNWWMTRMQAGAHPMQEKLTFFWHGHFTTSARDERSAWLMWSQNETLRRFAAGNFARFVHAISHDPAMLDYLNNQQNRKAHPNENYARELMELFTLGIGNYSEDDIKEVARAFTGYAHDGEAFVFRRFDHDTDVKTFLGRRGNFDGDDAVDIILQQRASAPYICSRIWNFFVNEQIDIPICQSLGDLLREQNFELRPVLRTLFSSKAFYAAVNVGSLIKSPVQLVVGTSRLLPTNRNLNGLRDALQQMGQVPFAPPNVKGWPGGRQWINTSTLFVRQNTAMNIARGEGKNAPSRLTDSSASSEQIVDHWLSTLIQRPVEADRRQVLVQSVGSTPTENGVRNLINLIVSMPEYQLC